MSSLRRHLSWIICAWLVCQVSAVIAGPLTPGEDRCTCPTAVHGAACPMHHAPENDENDGDCALRNAAPVSTVAVASMIGGVGVLPSTQAAFTALVPAGLVPAPAAVVVSRSERPESPPPRQ